MAQGTIKANGMPSFIQVSGSAPVTIPAGWSEAIIDVVVDVNNARVFTVPIAKAGMAIGTTYTHRQGYYVNNDNYGAIFLEATLNADGTCTLTLEHAMITGVEYINTTWIKAMYR